MHFTSSKHISLSHLLEEALEAGLARAEYVCILISTQVVDDFIWAGFWGWERQPPFDIYIYIYSS